MLRVGHTYLWRDNSYNCEEALRARIRGYQTVNTEQAYNMVKPYIQSQSRKLAGMCTGTFLNAEELEGVGIEAVVEVMPKVKEMKYETQVRSYLNQRIRGAMIDEIRLRTGYREKCEKRTISLDEMRTDDTNLFDTIADVEAVNPERFTKVIEDQEYIQHLCEVLTERERKIVYLRFYRELPLADMGKRFGITESMISQIIPKILAKLKQATQQKYSLKPSPVLPQKIQYPAQSEDIFIGMHNKEKIDKAISLFKSGEGIRSTARIAGMSKITASKIFHKINNLIELRCKCGQSIKNHRGWCSYRFKQSKKRQDFIKSWNKGDIMKSLSVLLCVVVMLVAINVQAGAYVENGKVKAKVTEPTKNEDSTLITDYAGTIVYYDSGAGFVEFPMVPATALIGGGTVIVELPIDINALPVGKETKISVKAKGKDTSGNLSKDSNVSITTVDKLPTNAPQL